MMAPYSQRTEPERIALVLVVCLSDLLLTGLVFGWAPLLLLLKKEGQYHERCTNPSEPACVEQENRLNLIFAVAAVTVNVGALPVGIFMDRTGPQATVITAAIIEVAGIILLAFAESQTFDVFVLAYSLIAFGGCITMMSSYPASFLIMRYQTAILAAISCLFDGSSVIFLVLYAVHERFGWTRRELLLGLAVVSTLVYLLLIILWGLNEKNLRSKQNSSVKSDEVEVTTHRKEPMADRQANNIKYDSVKMQKTTSESIPLISKPLKQDNAAFCHVDIDLLKQMKTFEFLFIVAYAAVQMLRATVYIGTTNKLLENYGDREHNYLYTKIFSFILPMGFIFVPFIDYLVEKRGLSKALQFTNALGVLYNVVELAPILPLQCIAFLLFTAFRAFLYAIISAFTAKTFGLKNMGSLIGIIFSVGSVSSLLLNVLSLLSCVLMIPLTMYLHKYEYDNEVQHRNEIARESGVAHLHAGHAGHETSSSLQ
ncbi:Major facilitator superfamily domain, general substrate transporter [Plasmopara halstedii]|uniref:Major facilitator superfamily domain, general substrate transporter n=1 Tax=Plasmopara halstedii TaxID=4781 RepID=A0A0P1AK04_PLAHL|nr:Major facilitator superfamily domain, general substrate transporter [Plasmopara halstedii]CEG41326.1 Major facilitator superfamily domain, general substrate transporter [Plasmopara halstedii]|eukprot:XP_024577695.1 Major facilitator superfamily domain, general substrate transporter [Plasmopara halstedii]